MNCWPVSIHLTSGPDDDTPSTPPQTRNNIVYPSTDEEYTLFLPVNEDFQRFYPIDWGFNPFLVSNFTRETILNHFVKGKLTSKDITNGMKVKTMGGKELVFKVGPGTCLRKYSRQFNDIPCSEGNGNIRLLYLHYRGKCRAEKRI